MAEALERVDFSLPSREAATTKRHFIERAVDLRRNLRELIPFDLNAAVNLGGALRSFGLRLTEAGQTERAVAILSESVDLLAGVEALPSPIYHTSESLPFALAALRNAHDANSDIDGALATTRREVKVLESRLTHSPDSAAYRKGLWIALLKLGDYTFTKRGDASRALHAYRRALEISSELDRDARSNGEVGLYRIHALNGVGQYSYLTGDSSSALLALAEAAQIGYSLGGRDQDTLTRRAAVHFTSLELLFEQADDRAAFRNGALALLCLFDSGMSLQRRASNEGTLSQIQSRMRTLASRLPREDVERIVTELPADDVAGQSEAVMNFLRNPEGEWPAN